MPLKRAVQIDIFLCGGGGGGCVWVGGYKALFDFSFVCLIHELCALS